MKKIKKHSLGLQIQEQSVSSSYRLFFLYHSKDLFSFISKKEKISGNFILCFVELHWCWWKSFESLFMAEKLKKRHLRLSVLVPLEENDDEAE